MLRIMIMGLGIAASAALGSPAVSQQSAAPTPKPISRSDVSSKLDTAFAAADANHDGSLNAAELGAMQQKSLQQMQTRARTELLAKFNQLDTNKDGRLSPEEFAAIATVRPNQTPEQILQKLDTNHDGKVSRDEARATELTAFDKLDANHDGVISVQEQAAARAQRR